jgi:hypothetical protein
MVAMTNGWPRGLFLCTGGGTGHLITVRLKTYPPVVVRRWKGRAEGELDGPGNNSEAMVVTRRRAGESTATSEGGGRVRSVLPAGKVASSWGRRKEVKVKSAKFKFSRAW